MKHEAPGRVTKPGPLRMIVPEWFLLEDGLPVRGFMPYYHGMLASDFAKLLWEAGEISASYDREVSICKIG